MAAKEPHHMYQPPLTVKEFFEILFVDWIVIHEPGGNPLFIDLCE